MSVVDGRREAMRRLFGGELPLLLMDIDAILRCRYLVGRGGVKLEGGVHQLFRLLTPCNYKTYFQETKDSLLVKIGAKK